MIRIILIISMVLTICSCASAPNGPLFSVNTNYAEDLGVVYVYRPPVNYAKAITFPVFLDGVKIADIAQKGYVRIPLKPGAYKLETKTSAIDEPINLNITRGESKYLRLSINKHDPLGFSATYFFQEKKYVEAEPEILKTKLEVDRYYGPK